MTDKADERFTTPAEVVVLRPGDPTPENALERAERIQREVEAERAAKREAAP